MYCTLLTSQNHRIAVGDQVLIEAFAQVFEAQAA